MGRSVAAVVGGMLLFAVLALLLGLVLDVAYPDAYGLDVGDPARAWTLINLGTTLVLGVVSGYVTARVAGRSEVWHGAAFAIALSLVGVATLILGISGASGAFSVVTIVVGAPAGILGAYLRARQLGRPNAPLPQ